MTDTRRIIYRLALLALALWGASRLFGLYQIHFPNRNHPMIPALQDMQTYCVGNYLIDLPRGSEPIRLETSLAGNRRATFFVKPDKTRVQFEWRVAERWEEIKDWKKELALVFDQPSQRFDAMPDGVVMTFKHRTTTVKSWLDGTSGLRSFYETEGYLWRDNTLYEFNSGSDKESLTNAMKTLQVRADDEIPLGQGFCGGRSFFPGQPDPNDHVWFAFRLPVEPNTEFRIELPAGQPPRPDLALFESDEIKVRKLRDAKRTLTGIQGREWIEYDWQKKWQETYKTSISAVWFGSGEGERGHPGIQMNLDTGAEAKGIAPPKVGEMIAVEGKNSMTVDEFVALWDGIVSTLRPRPGAF